MTHSNDRIPTKDETFPAAARTTRKVYSIRGSVLDAAIRATLCRMIQEFLTSVVEKSWQTKQQKASRGSTGVMDESRGFQLTAPSSKDLREEVAVEEGDNLGRTRLYRLCDG